MRFGIQTGTFFNLNSTKFFLTECIITNNNTFDDHEYNIVDSKYYFSWMPGIQIERIHLINGI